MVNKPCSQQTCSRVTLNSRVPSTYRSRSAGSLPNRRRRISQNNNYSQYVFGKDLDDSDFVREFQRPAVIQVIFYKFCFKKYKKIIMSDLFITFH